MKLYPTHMGPVVLEHRLRRVSATFPRMLRAVLAVAGVCRQEPLIEGKGPLRFSHKLAGPDFKAVERILEGTVKPQPEFNPADVTRSEVRERTLRAMCAA